MLVKCYEGDSDNRKLFEVPSNIRYLELQELVNQKFGGQPMQMSYLDEFDD